MGFGLLFLKQVLVMDRGLDTLLAQRIMQEKDRVMPSECYFTGKKTTFGKKRAYRGAKITSGGFGLKTTGITRRTFKPNLQSVNAVIEGDDGVKRVKRVKASAKAIRIGLVVKPLKRKYGYTRKQKEQQG